MGDTIAASLHRLALGELEMKDGGGKTDKKN